LSYYTKYLAVIAHYPVPPTMVVLKLICDVTRLWRNLAPPREFSAYATGREHSSCVPQLHPCLWWLTACCCGGP